ncbi:coagulation factor V-like [Orbicella faveolata]|uniref:coagulation factor V-like n=1 Tax=Orbicella faveolata TaxID=48498 RepID=UPI0009E2D746|nr:coagulation factor V-like [Orbicella faveolata]
MNPCHLISTFIFLTIMDVGFGQGWEILYSASSKENLSSGSGDNCFTKPVGVSDQKKIPDRQMTASSLHNNSQAAYGRLNGNRGNGWCTKEADENNDWLQIDLGKRFDVCGVATQGDINGHEWVTDFKMSYLSGGRMWTPYKDGNEDVEFNRKGGSKTVDQHKLPVSVSARYIRFHPTKRNKWNCLRVEIYGVSSKPVKKEKISEDKCVSLQEGDQSLPKDVEYIPMKWFETPSIVSLDAECTSEEALGLENGLVTNQQMSASSSLDKDHGPENARLNLAAIRGKTGAWAAKTNNQNQFLQVDFWRNVKITKLQTQGYHGRAWWVQKYTLSYSADQGSSSLPFHTYQENGADKVFTGNSDSDSVVTHVLQQPIIARYVLLKPKVWNDNIAMRAELYGCVLSGMDPDLYLNI